MTTTNDAAPAEFPKPGSRDGKEPCGECHIGPDETCDICGARHAPAPAPSGWLIELKGTVPSWAILNPKDYDEHWTTDSTRAIRFAREADAQAYIDHIGWTEAFPSEHIWDDGRAEPPMTKPPSGSGARVSDWLAVAKAAGKHGVRYRTNRALEAFLSDIAASLASDASPRGEAVAFSADGFRAVSDNGKRWRIVPDEGDWEMQPIGRVTAGEAQVICEGIVGLVRERDRFLRLWNEERTRAAHPAQGTVADVHEVGRDDLRRRAKKLLIDRGVKKNDRFPAFGIIDLMVDLAIDAIKNPPDRCVWPECGCCHDASCNEAHTRPAMPKEEDTRG